MSFTTLSFGPRRSAARAEASRRNGAKSKGPVSAAGKARSAQNARRHGLTSRTVVLATPEDRATHAELARAIAERYRPEGTLEEHWAARMVAALWRRTRLEIIESRVLEAMIAGEEALGLPSLATVSRYRARIARDLAEARRELETLQERRREERLRRALARATPERLRRLADRLQGRDPETDRRREPAGACPVSANGTNEPEPPFVPSPSAPSSLAPSALAPAPAPAAGDERGPGRPGRA